MLSFSCLLQIKQKQANTKGIYIGNKDRQKVKMYTVQELLKIKMANFKTKLDLLRPNFKTNTSFG